MIEAKEFRMIGEGLAGCSVAWHLHWRGAAFSAVDEGRRGAASPVAAGLINPVTGKNFQPSWRLDAFLSEATDFFAMVEKELGHQFWHPFPVVRLVGEKDWPKVARKLEQPDVIPWVEQVEEAVDGWRAAVTLKGGGRLDVKGFCRATRRHLFEGKREVSGGEVIRCQGAFGLLEGQMKTHRCAKGEILTLRIPGADANRILIGGGGWLIPVGNGLFKAGATYEWEHLHGGPTMAGRIRVEEILEALGIKQFEVVAHEAGIRPIVRRSMPLIGRLADGSAGFNGLGSKGALYAPGASRRLVDWLLDGRQIDEALDVERWLGSAD